MALDADRVASIFKSEIHIILKRIKAADSLPEIAINISRLIGQVSTQLVSIKECEDGLATY